MGVIDAISRRTDDLGMGTGAWLHGEHAGGDALVRGTWYSI